MDELTADGHRALLRVAKDRSKSADERNEARRRLSAALEVSTGMLMAGMVGSLARVGRECERVVGAIADMSVALERLSSVDHLEPGQRSAVCALGNECGMPVLDAIALVTESA